MKNSKVSKKEIDKAKKEIEIVRKRRTEIRTLLKKVANKNKRKPLLLENRILGEKMTDLKQVICHHPVTDMSTGGGIFCTVCDKYLGN